MTLDEKRLVIEALLCAGVGNESITVFNARKSVGVSYSLLWCVVDDDSGHGRRLFEEWLIEAAYRLIETSPVLRREWFGR